MVHIEVGQGDIAYNKSRNLLALIPKYNEVSYHLFEITNKYSNPEISLIRKTKWHPENKGYNIGINFFGVFLIIS